MMGGLPLVGMWERIQTLNAFEDTLLRMEAELNSYGRSLPDLLEAMKESALLGVVAQRMEEEGPMGFACGWRYCVEQYCVHLTEREQCAVAGLGEILGRYSLEEQLAFIHKTVAVIEEGKAETKNKLRTVSRLYMGTSLSLSLMLIVLLI